jgi:integrase
MTFAEAATRYLQQEERRGKVSLVTENYLLAPVVDAIGDLPLDQVHDGTLRPFIDRRLREGRAHKTINLSLGVVRHILNVAARKWRVDAGGGLLVPLLLNPPLLSMLDLHGHQREASSITWAEQRRLLKELPAHLARMALFTLNTGVRDDVVVNLQWAWEIPMVLDGDSFSVFEVPKRHVKGRKQVRYVVCNSVAQDVIESVRGQHPEYVFVYRRERTKNLDAPPLMPYEPVCTMNNTAWQSARRRAALGDLHVHDLRHTVGGRLREAGVPEETRAEVLWHSKGSITTHYSEAMVRELRSALELIKDDRGLKNLSLRTLSKLALESKQARECQVPSESLQQ